MARENVADDPRHWIGGLHAVRAALSHGDRQVLEIRYDPKRRDQRMGELLDLAHGQGVVSRPGVRKELDALLGNAGHQGVVARVRLPERHDEQYLRAMLKLLPHPPLLLILDGVQDPHNLGACLRSADAAGVDAVVVPQDRAAGITPVVCKVASGAAESIPLVAVRNLSRALRWLRRETGIWIVGAAGEAETSLYDADLTGPLALVMGGEAKGLRRLTREYCDVLAALPMAGKVSSLNVSVATGICLFEAVRQRAGHGKSA